MKSAEFMPVVVFIESPKIEFLIKRNQYNENNSMKRSVRVHRFFVYVKPVTGVFH